jgi:hypothetical protein
VKLSVREEVLERGGGRAVADGETGDTGDAAVGEAVRGEIGVTGEIGVAS